VPAIRLHRACACFLLCLQAFLLALFGVDPLLLFLPLAIELFLLFLCLLLEHIALDVRTLAPHLDIHRTRAALRTGQPQFRLRLALERNATRRTGCSGAFLLAMTAAEVRQKLELRILANRVIRSADLDPGLVELRQQSLNRYLQYVCELFDGDVSHSLTPQISSLRLAAPLRTNAPGLS
jgi:hypothetical protein